MQRRTLLTAAALAVALITAPALPAAAQTAVQPASLAASTPSAAMLSGSVTLSGAARAGVPVGWYSPGGTVLTSTATDADGHYSMPAPPAGTTYFLTANVASVLVHPRAAVHGWRPVYIGATTVEQQAAPLVIAAVSDGADRTVDLDVPKAVRISGRNAAFAGRTVTLLTASRSPTDSTRASGTGAWSFLVTPGTYRIGVEGNVNWLDYQSQRFLVGPRPFVKSSSPTRTATLTGRLTVAGRPAAHVPVRWDGPYQGDEAPDELAYTDANGRYRLRGLVPGHFVLRFGNAGDQNDGSPYLLRTRSRDLAAGTTTTLNVALTRGATISATVRTSTGSKRWTTLLTRGSTLVRTTALTAHAASAANRLQVRGLPSGTYVLRLTDGVHALTRTVHVTAGQTGRLGTLRPAATPLTISGSGPADALVTAAQGSLVVSTRVTSAGTYRLSGLLPGRYTVTSSGSGYRPTSVRATVSADTTLDVALGAAESTEFRQVTGTVVAGSVPLPLGQIVLANGPTLSVRNGQIVVTALHPGHYLVARLQVLGSSLFPVDTPYDVEWAGPDITVVSGSDTHLPTVELSFVG